MARLVAITGPKRGHSYKLGESCTLGRSPLCQVFVEDGAASRQHAEIRLTGDRYVIEDLRSVNGTYVNENRITRHVLDEHDKIRIAGWRFSFESETSLEPESILTRVSEPQPLADDRIRLGLDARPEVVVRQVAETDGPEVIAQLYERLRTICVVANAISTSLDLDELLGQVLDAVLRVFPQSARGVILLVDRKTGSLRPHTVRHREGMGAQGEVLISRTVVKEVLEKKRAVIFGGLADRGGGFTGSWLHSMMCAPLLVRGEVLGMIHLISQNLLTTFAPADLDLLVGIAAQAAIALQNAEMHAELLARERMAYDMKVAREIQRQFLPLGSPVIDRWTFATEYVPAQAVGGDFYDFIKLGPGRLGVLIGDVCGKGVSAALLMARITSEFRNLVLLKEKPTEVMAGANATLARTAYEGIFATACYLELDLLQGVMTVCNAGHLPPMVRRRDGGVDRLPFDGVALGVLDSAEFEQHEYRMKPGDVVLLMTDGVVEATDAYRNQLGFERLEVALREEASNSEGVLGNVLRTVGSFVGGAPQYDDLTLVCFHWEGAVKTEESAPPEPGLAGDSTGERTA